VTADDYPDVFAALAAAVMVRRPGDPGARVRILGPLEARLQRVDRAVLGGLNEGTWPPRTSADAWLSRPMRHALGLDLPERRVGLAAHDFTQLAGTRDLVLTRALKQDGVPQIASRFLQRLMTVAGATASEEARRRGLGWLALARHLDRPAGPPQPAPPPAPTPPVNLRPTRFSVTEIETLLRDPYAIYARHVLRLQPLDPVDELPGAAERGTLIHDIMHRLASLDTSLPRDAFHTALVDEARRVFAREADRPEARAIWWPKFLRIASRIVDWHLARVRNAADILVECQGRTAILTAGNRTIILAGRADRLERDRSGHWSLIDFKTGQLSKPGDETSGLAPQLPLEAAMLARGAFGNLPQRDRIGDLLLVRLSGSREPLTQRSVSTPKGVATGQFAEDLWQRVSDLLRRYEDPAMPYLSGLFPKSRDRAGAYDHLARRPEWAADGEEDAS
jgi:ATP-dependent helicase/nuclease subunit B